MGKLLATVATFGLGIALASGAWAQENKSRSGNSETQTIRGVVAAVAAEGELAIDYRTKQAVLVEDAFLTVVGSPANGQDGESSNAASKPGDSDKQRENIYIVWLSPRTKVYQASGDAGKSDQKTEASLDRLEVGDRVEIQFRSREESNKNAGANQTEQMRRKHGRDRTYYGDATAITILPSKNKDKSSKGS